MQLSFRLDKRPGESHLALDGKKLLGPAPFAFALLLCWMAKRISGWGSAFRLLSGCFCVLFCFDLACYMTKGVNVDFISNCFFTCKDRALERDRPYQGEKERTQGAPNLNGDANKDV